MQQASLFSSINLLPEGCSYQEDFISADAEAALLARIGSLPLHEAQYKEWTAKRRVMCFGGRYDFSTNELLAEAPLPEWLHGLRAAIAEWSSLPAHEFNHAIIAEYQTGTQLGWHRDVRDFEAVIGISLAGTARMRFRPYPPQSNDRAAIAIELQPRSIYALTGPSRWQWQHAISPTKCHRYSITFRMLRK
jgi:alkylated DNA repair dioxygenase AlkB